ncbi:PP2C family protein-serine/threonine phosphatase [Roseovarius indicus]|uniref:PP2C family protein-serine/threonine phosphatase n=1 Tax=Roseovarius indicus TaxID=540747 RepID=UPI0032EDC253
MVQETDIKPNLVHRAKAVRKVLVVDDSKSLRTTLSRMLMTAGYDVREASSGHKALQLCHEDPPDLVLSDWMMPGLSGLEFCEEFRKMHRDGYGYFILLTSKSDKQDMARGFDAGADDFLTKPVNSGELRARITAAERVVRMERELTEKNRMIRTTLDELQSIHDSINGDLIEARRLQQSLVRDRQRDFGGAEVSLMLHSCGHVGGDLVGMFPINMSEIGIYGIDVSGHGISSALMTARLAGYLSAHTPEQNIAIVAGQGGDFLARCPRETVAILNELILGEIETEHYFTLLLAIANIVTGDITFVQAGHPSPIVQRASGAVEIVGDGGFPVGLLNRASYRSETVRLAPGDRFLIHSDGITESRRPDGRMLSEVGLSAAMQDARDLRGLVCLETLVCRMTDFTGSTRFEDDVSAVLLEFRGRSGMS